MQYPTALNISWLPPHKPNGPILFYQVEIDNKIKYNGKNLNTYVVGLRVYTKYTLKILVCGLDNCTSNQLDVFTGQLSPNGVIAPQLRVLGIKRIEVKWMLPTKLNGEIQGYEIFVGTSTSITNLKSVFNATATTYETVINNLIPGSLYFFRIKAFTRAGGTLGDASQARTVESAPEDIPKPEVKPQSSSTLLVTIFAPRLPNGIVTQYILFQNSVNVLDMLRLPKPYLVENLQPYSKHLFQVKVCTSKGCGFSDIVSAYTGHAPPVGSISLVATSIKSHSLDVTWTAISKPNGPITYTLIVTGEFYVQPGVNFDTRNRTVHCYTGDTANKRVSCNVLPYASYEAFVNGSNDAGFIFSNTISVTTPADGKYVLLIINIKTFF